MTTAEIDRQNRTDNQEWLDALVAERDGLLRDLDAALELLLLHAPELGTMELLAEPIRRAAEQLAIQLAIVAERDTLAALLRECLPVVRQQWAARPTPRNADLLDRVEAATTKKARAT